MFDLNFIVDWILNQRYSLSLVLKGHGQPVNCLAFNTTATLLASGGDDEQVRIWDMTSSEPSQTLADPSGNWGQITCALFLNLESSTAVFTEISALRVFSAGDSVECIAYDPRNQRLAVTSHYGSIKMFKFGLGQPRLPTELWSSEFADAIPRAVKFSENGESVLVYGMNNGKIICYDTATSTEKFRKSLESSIGNVSWCSITGNMVVDNMEDGFDLYGPSRTTAAREFKIPTTRKFVKKAAFGENGKAIICGSDHGLAYVFRVDCSEPIHKLKHGKKTELIQVVETAATEDYNLIATASSENKFGICLWRKPMKKTRASQRSSHHILEILVVVNTLIFTILVWMTSETWLPAAHEHLGSAKFAISKALKQHMDAFGAHPQQETPGYGVTSVDDLPLSIAEIITRLDEASLRRILGIELSKALEGGADNLEGDADDLD